MTNNFGPLVGSGFLHRSDRSRLNFTHGSGAYVYADRGECFIDFILGVGPVIIGHSHKEFNELLVRELDRGLNLPSYSSIHYEYAERLMHQSPGKHVAVLFAKTASEAVAFALRLVALETDRLGVVRCGYLGQSDVAIGRSIKWHEPLHSRYRMERKLLSGCRGFEPTEPVFDWVDLDLDTLHGLLASNPSIGALAIDAHQIAFIGDERFPDIIRCCQSYGVRIVLDETKTAGRVGSRGYFDSFAGQLDYIILGKAVGNGAPLAILTGSNEKLDLYKYAKIGGTHSKEIFGAAAGMATLTLMNRYDGYTKIKEITRTVVESFNTGITDAKQSDVVARGFFQDSLFEICFDGDLLNDQARRDKIKLALQDCGVLILEGHCSFICLDHAGILGNKFTESISQAFKNLDHI